METLKLEYIGNDGFSRPVYKNNDRLFVDVDPVAHIEPNICTVLNNVFGGEPDTPIRVMKKYENVQLDFIPQRVTW